MLFGFYMNNLPSAVKSHSINSYADDTKVYLSFSSAEDTDSCLAKIIEDLRHIAGRSCSQQLMINLSKTGLILFGTRQLLNRVKGVTITLLSQDLISVPSVKVLGIILDSSLSFNDHHQ